MLTINWQEIKILFAVFIFILLGIVCRAEQIELRYWFNQDSDKAKTITSSSEIKSLELPFQGDNKRPLTILNIQIKDSSGLWSVPYRCIFSTPVNGDAELMYNIDSYSFNKLEDNCIDVLNIYSGLHKVSVIDKRHTKTPVSTINNKDTPISTNLKLTLTSSRDRLQKEALIKSSDNGYAFDFKNITSGIYPVNFALTDTESGTLVALESALVDVKVPMGNRLTNIYYWLNDSMADHRNLELSTPIPVSKSVELPLADFNIPSLDNHLTVEDGTAYIAPNYNIAISFRNSYGFAADSTAWITDNSKRTELQASELKAASQHDVDKWKTDTCYWYQFKAQTGDQVAFSARLRCKVKMYSPDAVLLDTATFNNEKKELRARIAETGIYYVQLSEIEQSRREFSVLLSYLSGPSVENKYDNKDIVYEGIPIEWEKASDWKNDGKIISYTKSGIKMTVDGTTSQYEPYIAEKSLLCRVYPGNILCFDAKGYIEKITLCLPKMPDYEYPRITTPYGEINVDTFSNVVVWNGFSNQAIIKIDDSDDDMLLPLTKAYVKLSELDENDIIISDDGDNGFSIDYQSYNIIRLWRAGNQEAWYRLEDVRIVFKEHELLIRSKGVEYSHSTKEKLILTFDFDNTSGADEDVDITLKPFVAISGDNIVISGLPAYVGIYSVAGQTYFSRYVNESELSYPISNLPSGIYIITVEDKSTKLIIP